MLGPFGQLTHVEDLVIKGDIPAEYKNNLLNKIRGLEPSGPLPDMYHALQRYVTSYSMLHRPIASYKIEDDLWQLTPALEYAAAGELEKFKQHRRRFGKKLGDLRQLDDSVLYAYDPKDGTTR